MTNSSTVIVSAVLVIAFFAAVGYSQNPPANEKPPTAQPPPPSCPTTLAVRGPQGPVRDGMPVRFVLNIGGGNPQSPPVFSWSISSGTIKTGQGTTTIDVDSTGAGADRTMTATVMLSGYPPECAYDASATITIAGPAHKIDEFGTVNEEDEMMRLDGTHSAMAVDDIAYIIAYGGKTSVRGLANADLRRMRAYLLKIGVSPDRMVTIDGGYREEPLHEIWLVPVGAEPPRPRPTVNPKDVVFPKPTPAAGVKKP